MKKYDTKKYKAPTYYFEFILEFKNDYDVKSLENILKLKPYSVITLSESKQKLSKGTHYDESGNPHSAVELASAKFTYRTEYFNEINISKPFDEFLNNVKDNLIKIQSILNENQGSISFCTVFTSLDEKPYLYLSKDAIQILSSLNADLDTDYV